MLFLNRFNLLHAGNKKRSIRKFWIRPFSNFTICRESCQVLCKGTYIIFLVKLTRIRLSEGFVNVVFLFQVLRKAMKGLGTHDSSLIWVIVTRAEIDLQYIKEEYKRKYGKSLSSAVSSEISGHYRSFLLALLGPKRID